MENVLENNLSIQICFTSQGKKLPRPMQIISEMKSHQTKFEKFEIMEDNDRAMRYVIIKKNVYRYSIINIKMLIEKLVVEQKIEVKYKILL